MYSQLIAWLKILLPLGALALLSTIFLLSQDNDPIARVPILTSGIDPAEGEQVGTPFFAGTTTAGNALTISAEIARSTDGSEPGIEADALRVQLDLKTGGRVQVDAGTGILLDGADRIFLTNGVRVTTANGYDLMTNGLNAAIETLNMESTDSVTATGPATTIQAGKLVVQESGENGDVLVLFTDGVKLVYIPQTTRAE